MSEALRGREGMRPFGELTPYAEALHIALGLCEPIVEPRRVPLLRAGGRLAAADITAPVDVPSTDRAAMDGFAVIAADLDVEEARVVLQPVGRIFAGTLEESAIVSGQCCEVATGAQMPRGADAVVPVEQTDIADGAVVIVDGVQAGDHVSQRGEDLERGAAVVFAGAPITPGAAAALASIGVAEVEVRRPPKVLLVPTGDELVPLGEELRPGQVYDSNSVGVRLLLEASGAEVEHAGIVRDELTELIAGVEQGGFDLVVTLGGTSVGRHDLVLDVVEARGEVLVHGIAIKPGKPVLVARVGDTPLLGLPGFPASCLFTGHTFAEPMVRRLAGLALDHRRRAAAVLSAAVRSPAGKLQFLTVTVEGDRATPAYRASSTITSMSGADGWIEIPQQTTALDAGSPVEVTFF